MKIQESAENYLESVLMIKNRKGSVRSIDIASELGFSKPSVSVAMKKLREDGCITVDTNGHIDLTDKGLEIAQKIYARHRLLTRALIAIGVNETTAAEDACRIEHCISSESFERLKEYCKDKFNIK